MNYAARTMLSFISFNLGWWACAHGASHQAAWLGPALAPLWIGLHIYYSPVAKGESIFLISLSAIGFAIDTILIRLGLFATIPAQALAPLWLVTMWILLGLTYESLLMMRRKPVLLLISGGISGPFAYYCTEAVNILKYARPLWVSLLLHALLWAALTAALLKWREIILRRTEAPPASRPHPGAVQLSLIPPEAELSGPDKLSRPPGEH